MISDFSTSPRDDKSRKKFSRFLAPASDEFSPFFASGFEKKYLGDDRLRKDIDTSKNGYSYTFF